MMELASFDYVTYISRKKDMRYGCISVIMTDLYVPFIYKIYIDIWNLGKTWRILSNNRFSRKLMSLTPNHALCLDNIWNYATLLSAGFFNEIYSL